MFKNFEIGVYRFLHLNSSHIVIRLHLSLYIVRECDYYTLILEYPHYNTKFPQYKLHCDSSYTVRLMYYKLYLFILFFIYLNYKKRI